MSTSTSTTKSYRLVAGCGDAGYGGQPGSGIAEKSVTIYAAGPTKWVAVAEVKTGTNQGYNQWDYEYGPWEGRGASPAEAVERCLRRADDEYRADLRRAAIDATNEAADATYHSLAAAEADRIQGVLDRGERDGCTHATVAGVRHYADTREARDAIRRAAVAELRRIATRGPSRLAHLSDDDLLAEARRRGLI